MWAVFLIAASLLLSIFQTILYAQQTPEGTLYPLVHNFVEDYYQYLDIMRQGYDGWWGATSRLTPEVYPRMVVSVFLLTLGHIARVFHLWVPVVYTGARALGALALMTLVYQLIKKVYPSSFFRQLIALCFVLFSTYWWGWGSGGPTVAPLTHAWTELDPIFRWSFVPHHLWSKVGMLAAFLLLLRPSSIRHTSYVMLPVFAMGFTNPVVYATFVPTLSLYLLLSLARGGLARLEWRAVGAIGIAAPVLFYHRYLQTTIFPWTSYGLWEQTLAFAVKPWDYAVSLGPTLPLFLLALPAIWRMGSVGKLLIAWAASSWVMMYIAGPFVPVTIERYLGGYQFIPLAIGAASLFSLTRPPLARLILVIALLIYFSVGLYASFKEHAGYVAANRNNFQVYIPADLMGALTYLGRNGSSEDVVMAPYEISTMTPGLTGRRVLAGHALFTKDVAAKKALINEFFTTSDEAAAQRILMAYNVAYVLARSAWNSAWSGSILTPVFRNSSYTVFSALKQTNLQ